MKMVRSGIAMKNLPLNSGFFDRVSDIVRTTFNRPKLAQLPASKAIEPVYQVNPPHLLGLEALEPLPALLLSRSAALEDPGCWLAESGFWVVHSGSVKDEVQGILAGTRQWSILMVAIDDFGGVANVIDDLLWLRQIMPELPIILLSAEVQSDDFSSSRQTLCDATLRLPVSLPRFSLAISEATINNARWVRHWWKSLSRED